MIFQPFVGGHRRERPRGAETTTKTYRASTSVSLLYYQDYQGAALRVGRRFAPGPAASLSASPTARTI
jgi:hypothetical protein